MSYPSKMAIFHRKLFNYQRENMNKKPPDQTGANGVVLRASAVKQCMVSPFHQRHQLENWWLRCQGGIQSSFIHDSKLGRNEEYSP